MSDRVRVIGFSKPPGLAVALRGGGFSREGIDVDFARTPSSQRQIRGLLAGEWDIAHTAVDNVFEYVDAENADLVLVLVGEIGTDVRLLARDATGIPSLRGKRLGVDSPRSGYALMAYLILGTHGIDRGDYTVHEFGGSTERGKALAAGEVDFAMLGSPHAEDALAAGCRVLAEARTYVPGYPGLTVAVRRTWAAANGDLLTRYLRALLGGIRAASGAAPPPVPEMREAVRRALEMRRSVVGGGTGAGIDRYVDLSFAAEAAKRPTPRPRPSRRNGA